MMTNEQAALIAAASQIGFREHGIRTPVETISLAEEYVTWLDMQDRLDVEVHHDMATDLTKD